MKDMIGWGDCHSPLLPWIPPLYRSSPNSQYKHIDAAKSNK